MLYDCYAAFQLSNHYCLLLLENYRLQVFDLIICCNLWQINNLVVGSGYGFSRCGMAEDIILGGNLHLAIFSAL